MNSDNYEFSKSAAPQSVGDYSAYANKQWNSINDINSGVYTNNGLTLVQWDLSSIYNSSSFVDVSDLYMTIPLVMVATCSNNSTILNVPSNGGYALCTLKSNYQHLIHQIEIAIDGKTIQDMQPYLSVYKNFKLLSQLSATDLKSMAPSLGLSDVLDNEKSMTWTTHQGRTVANMIANVGATTVASSYQKPGIGLCNNLPFSPVVANNGALAGALPYSQNTGATNDAILKRASKIVDTTGSFNNFVGTASATNGAIPSIVNLTNLTTEFRSVYQTSGNVMSWQDFGIIPLKYFCDVIDKMGLVKKCSIQIRAWINTGSVQINVNVPNPNTGTIAIPVYTPSPKDMSYSTISSTFSATCPFTVNYLPYNNFTSVVSLPIPTLTAVASATTYQATNINLITAGLYVATAPQSFGSSTSINISTATSILSNPMKACRIYYSQVALTPQKALAYVEANTNKQVVYESVLWNQYSNITAGSSFSQLVQSGIKNPVGVVIIPFISPSNLCAAGETSIIGFSQMGSPYDTCPATYAPIPLTNLQVQLGGVNVLNSSLFYSYENFLSQVSLAECLSSADIGLSAGLINQAWWENNRVYYVDLARGSEADKATSRNLNISFTNNSLLIIDVMVFTIYLNRIVLNVETGSVKS